MIDRKKYPVSFYFLETAENLAKIQNYHLMISLGTNALKESPDTQTCATIYCWMSDASAAMGNHVTADCWAKNAYVLAAIINDTYNMVWSLLIQAKCINKTNPSEALDLNRRAEKLYDLNSVKDRKLLAHLLFNELLITTGENWKYGPDSVLVERILDICMDLEMHTLATWTLLRISEYIADDKPSQIAMAKLYMSWIEVDRLPENSLELKTYDLVKQKVNRTPTPPAPASEATFLNQYGSWIAGATVVAGLALAGMYLKPKL